MKKIQIVILAVFLTGYFSNYAQTPTAYRVSVSNTSIPGEVMKSYKERYPDVLTKGWYATHITYWQNDYSAGWYTDWYGQRTMVVYSFEKPTYFEVDFVDNPGEQSRAVYNLHGYWYETRTKLKALPLVVSDAIKNSEYSGWNISALKERIDAPSWPRSIYRFKVSKGLKSRIIRVDEEGTIVQVKYINE